MAVHAGRRDIRGDLRGEQQVPRIFRLQIRGKNEMRVRHIAVAVALLVASNAFAQARGSLVGTVRLPDGPVARATIQATQSSTGPIFTATNAAPGQFVFRDLPAGTYEVSVPGTGIATVRFAQQNVVVEAGKPTTLDIALQKANLGVLGDDNAYLAIRNKYTNLQGRAPRMPDG